MFYDLNLLCPKRRGKFAIIWIAATRGLPYVKKMVDTVDIPHVCDEILKFVMSDSRSPRHRLSLYLSAKLIYGAVLVHNKQVKTLEIQTVNFFISIKRPMFRCEPEDEVEETSRRRVNKKRQTKKVTANDQNLQEMREVPQIERNVNVTDPIHITLPDEQFTRTRILDEDLFGDEGQLDLQLVQVEDITRVRVTPQPKPHPIPLTTEQVQPVPDANEIAAVEELGLSPSKRRRSEIQPVSPVTLVQQHDTLSPEGQDRLLMPPPPPPAEPSPAGRRSERIATLPDQLCGRDSPGFRRKGPRRLTLGTIKPLTDQHERFQEIDFPLHSGTVVKLLSPKCIVVPRRSQSPTDFIADILRPVAHTEEDIRQVRNDETTASTSRRLRSRTQIQQPEAVVPNVDVTEPETVPEERIPQQQEIIPDGPFIPQEIIPDVPFIPSPRMSRVPPVDNVSIQEDISENVREQRVYTSTPLGIETEAKRHKLLLNKIRQLFIELDTETVTLEMICQPLNRVNVAKTFNGLLHLNAQGYVTLKSCTDSVELKEICRGPRL